MLLQHELPRHSEHCPLRHPAAQRLAALAMLQSLKKKGKSLWSKEDPSSNIFGDSVHSCCLLLPKPRDRHRYSGPTRRLQAEDGRFADGHSSRRSSAHRRSSLNAEEFSVRVAWNFERRRCVSATVTLVAVWTQRAGRR